MAKISDRAGKGYGFIQFQGRRVFVHADNIRPRQELASLDGLELVDSTIMVEESRKGPAVRYAMTRKAFESHTLDQKVDPRGWVWAMELAQRCARITATNSVWRPYGEKALWFLMAWQSGKLAPASGDEFSSYMSSHADSELGYNARKDIERYRNALALAILYNLVNGPVHLYEGSSIASTFWREAYLLERALRKAEETDFVGALEAYDEYGRSKINNVVLPWETP